MPITNLFSPLTLRSINLENRIVVPPMSQYSAHEGCATPWHLMHLGSLAIAGAGLVFVEATAVEPHGRASYSCMGLWNDAQTAALKPIVDFCRRHGNAKLGIQLQHTGRKGSTKTGWEGRAEATPGWPLMGPSAVPYPGRPIPKEMDDGDIASIIDKFSDAARRADAAGFDVIELHNAHGYLLHSFLSPHSNYRNDRYGGSLENRMRMPLEVFEAVRAVWPEGKALGVRVTATDWTEQGWSVEDTVEFAKALKARGCDYICASSGGSSPDQVVHPAPNYQVGFAERIRNEADIPTMAIGLITEPHQAEEILSSGQADLIGIARATLNNPRWPAFAARALGEKIYVPLQYLRGVDQALQRPR